MSCSSGCFQASVQQCADIIIRAGFPSNYSLYWTVQKPGKSVYSKRTATENNGDLVISADDLPDGYLFAGDNIKIRVRLGSNYLQPVLMTLDGEQFECITATLQNIIADDDVPVNVIQGSTAVVPDGPGTNYLIPVVSADFQDENGDPSVDTFLHDGLDGKLLAIFWNDIPRYLTNTEWQHVDGGIKILVPDFDATDNSYQLFIYIIGNEI